MAKIRNMGGNQSNQKKCSFYSKMFWLMTLLCILDFAFWIYPIAFAPESFDRKIAFVIFAVTACFSAVLAKIFGRKYSILHSGLAGEKKTGSILSKLPDSYVVLQNVSITKNGKHTEMDNLIISPYGICIVEVKNHNGCIQGNQKDEMWTQHKTGQKGTPYTSMFKNPLKQLGFQKYLLSTLLKEHNMDLWINGAVFFSGAEGLETDCDHVFASEQDMIFWIMNDQQIKLSDHEIMQIQKLLSQAV
jgi:hypothetical protein